MRYRDVVVGLRINDMVNLVWPVKNSYGISKAYSFKETPNVARIDFMSGEQGILVRNRCKFIRATVIIRSCTALNLFTTAAFPTNIIASVVHKNNTGRDGSLAYYGNSQISLVLYGAEFSYYGI
jgi:hypothetical protein